MFDLVSKSFNFSNPIIWVDLGISLLIFIAVSILLFRHLKRKMMIAIYIVESTLVFASWFFSLNLLWSISLAIFIITTTAFMFINVAEFRPLFSNSLANIDPLGKKGTGKIYDRHALYLKIETAVKALSKSRTGAIMTFEKKVELTDVVKSGTMLNAPVSPELLMTIFYPGTRLHDGAVVIRRDMILAASVYYNPTTKPLTGKFGSRHRAAIGISEITDSVTVVVSEETGRISLAVAGELIPVNVDNFLRTFEDYMFEEEKTGK